MSIDKIMEEAQRSKEPKMYAHIHVRIDPAEPDKGLTMRITERVEVGPPGAGVEESTRRWCYELKERECDCDEHHKHLRSGTLGEFLKFAKLIKMLDGNIRERCVMLGVDPETLV